MDAWAARYNGRAAFICVSCAGPQLAERFGQQLQLSHCHNSYVDNANMPRWGQLGCSGFIILDQRHSVVCKATAPFLEVMHRVSLLPLTCNES